MLAHNSSFAGRREYAALQAARDALGARIWLVQRLDRGTSGLMLVVFDGKDVASWSKAIAAGRKEYLAVARGRLSHAATVDAALKDEKGVLKEALSHIQPVAQSPHERVSLVRCRLETGRIHQARRHLNRLSHPVVNDANHGDTRFNRGFRERWGVSRLLLHASDLGLTHPHSGDSLQFKAPLDDQMASLISRLFGEVADLNPPSEPDS